MAKFYVWSGRHKMIIDSASVPCDRHDQAIIRAAMMLIVEHADAGGLGRKVYVSEHGFKNTPRPSQWDVNDGMKHLSKITMSRYRRLPPSGHGWHRHAR